MNRINWIDWVKAIAVITVVFCHLPQSQEWFYFRYLQASIITLFFFLSGYLKKDRGSTKENWQKYWRGLILPYLIYNLLFLPYWILKHYLTIGALPTGAELMSPIVGALLLEHRASFCEPLNGPLWYLPSVLIMHVLTDSLHKSRYVYHWIVGLCLASFLLYYAHRYFAWPNNLTPVGTIRRLPYYYLGYVLGRNRLFRDTSLKRDLTLCLCCLALSIGLFYLHLHEGRLLPHIALFYPFNVSFLFAVLCGCKLLNGHAPRLVTNLSIGTLAVIGLHWIVIGCINHGVLPLLGLSNTTSMTWYEALPLSLFIVGVIYPVIVLSKRHFPILLGK